MARMSWRSLCLTSAATWAVLALMAGSASTGSAAGQLVRTRVDAPASVGRTHDSRPSVVYRPPGLSPSARVPLLIALHGRGQSPQALASSTGFNALADRNGFVVAYLASASTVNWDAAEAAPTDDVGYISD